MDTLSNKTRCGVVAIVGRPNVGKSTLLNHLMGQDLAIVSQKAQTTRDLIRGIYTEGDLQIVFTDTPGIHRAKEGGLNQALVSRAEESLEDPDLVWYLVDPHSDVEHERVVWASLMNASKAQVVLVWNKLDLKDRQYKQLALRDRLLQNIKETGISLVDEVAISAEKGNGVQSLLALTSSRLPEAPHLFLDPDQASERPLRFFAAELIRSELYEQLEEELPYSAAVRIDTFKESEKPIRIDATIVVERDSQKGMVIGKGGLKIKSIGSKARKRIETLVGGKVYLGLRVDVLPKWTREKKHLEALGYHLPERG